MIEFDQPLDEGSTPDAASFRFDTGSGTFNGTGEVLVAGSTISVTVATVGGISLGATCEYTAAGPPIYGENGEQVVAFAGVPVELV